MATVKFLEKGEKSNKPASRELLKGRKKFKKLFIIFTSLLLVSVSLNFYLWFNYGR